MRPFLARFPIGKTEQVKTWDHSVLKGFWEKWYFPANATLYIVGDLDRETEDVVALIDRTFGRIPPARQLPASGNGNGAGEASTSGGDIKDGAAAAMVSALNKALGTSANSTAAAAATANNVVPVPESSSLLKQRHAVRPPVEHEHGCGPLAPGEGPAAVKIFRHPLLQHFMLSIFCKLPIRQVQTMKDLKDLLMLRIVLSVFQFRINARYVDPSPKFLGIELDISDSAREGCAVSTLTITAEPRDWQGAVAVAVQEVRRLQRHGLTQGEFERYREAILRDSGQVRGGRP